MLLGGDDSNAIRLSAPTLEDATSFKASAIEALARFSVINLNSTDLAESCGVSEYPCADQILRCADTRLVRAADGTLTPLTSACDCFVSGYSDSIPVPSNPDVVFSCPYTCVQSLLALAAAHVAAANGPAGPPLSCAAPIAALAAAAFGGSSGYLAGASDSDALRTMPADDPRVLRAAEALRIAINARRRRDCPALRPYGAPARVVYARRGLAGGGRGEYRLEAVFPGGDAVFARVAHLPPAQQPVDPAAEAALGDPGDLAGRFELASAVPGPCDAARPEQLAVSAAGGPRPSRQRFQLDREEKPLDREEKPFKRVCKQREGGGGREGGRALCQCEEPNRERAGDWVGRYRSLGFGGLGGGYVWAWPPPSPPSMDGRRRGPGRGPKGPVPGPARRNTVPPPGSQGPVPPRFDSAVSTNEAVVRARACARAGVRVCARARVQAWPGLTSWAWAGGRRCARSTRAGGSATSAWGTCRPPRRRGGP